MNHRPPRVVRALRALGALAIAAAIAPNRLRAQEITSASRGDTLHAARTPAGVPPIVVDGLLTDSAWSAAPVLSSFRQRDPAEGEPATEETEVRVIYAGDVLYIGVRARDREPQKVVARLLARDRVMSAGFDGRPQFAGDDAVAILLDPFHDHRNAFVFATNPNGAEFDGLITDEGRGFNIDWRGVWSVAARRNADGWSAEFAIPFRTLRYPATGEVWGFNVYRMIRRKNEEVMWRSWLRGREGFARVSRAGHLAGLSHLPRPGLNADLKPFAVTGADREWSATGPAGRWDGTGQVGLDLKSEVRPGLVLDATLNTDFAQVEADDQQVNLTRFDLFFPEKREFFLENAGIFEFGATAQFEPPPYQLFFSRQIGINPDSGEVPLLGGARLTGRMGSQTLGVLSAFTGEKYGDPRTAFHVLRVKRDAGGANYLGAMLVDRRSDSTWNTAGGIDWSFWPTSSWNVQGFVSRTATQGAGGDGTAWRLSEEYQTSNIGANLSHLVIGSEANAEAGFITRTDIRRTQGDFRYTIRPKAYGLRRVNLRAFTDYVTNLDWQRQDWNVSLGVSPTWNVGDNIGVFWSAGSLRVDEAFDLADTVTVPIGTYATRSWSIFGQTSPSRPLVLGLNADLQETFGGRVNRVGGSLSTALGKHVAIRTGYDVSKADLPDGGFTAHLVSVRTTWAFTTKLTLNSLLQYNSLDRDVSTNIRLGYIHRPGSDIFIVLNEQRGSDLSPWDLRTRGMRFKVTYLTRL